MSSEERRLMDRMAPLGVPDDLVEVALDDEPSPTPEMAARMRAKVLERATGGAAPGKRLGARRWYRWAAAAAAVALLGVMATGPSRVMAKMASLFSFVPGFGMQQSDSFLLYSPNPVQVAYKGGTVEVPGLMATEDGVTVRLIRRGYESWGTTRQIRLVDESGRSLRSTSMSGSSRALYWEEWLSFAGGVDGNARTLTLVLEDGDTELRIPVPLALATGESPLAQFGPGAEVNGLSVAAQVLARPDRTEVSLLLQGEQPLAGQPGAPAPLALEGRLSAPGWEAPVTQESAALGQMRTLSAAPLPGGVEQVRLAIDQLRVAEEGMARLTIPTAPGPVDRTVRLGRWDVTVTRLERAGNVLRVYVDLGPGGSMELAGIGQISVVGVPGGVGLGTRWDSNRPAWFELELLGLQQVPESITLQLENPELRIDGPWVIDVPVRR